MSVERVGEDEQQRERLYRLVIVALVGVLVATWVAVIWLVQGKSSAEDDLEQAERENAAYAAGPDAQAAAERALDEILSYDYREIEDEFAWTSRFTDELRSEYEGDLVKDLRKLIERFETVARGEVVESAYEVAGDEVQVIAFIRQRLTTKADRKADRAGVVDERWTELTMVRDGDDWLVAKIDPFNIPPPRSS